MAKKKTAEKGEPKDVARCDTLNEVTPNHDELITSVAQSSPESVQKLEVAKCDIKMGWSKKTSMEVFLRSSFGPPWMSIGIV